jgi:L-threonate 2-dehydrogenase
MTASVKIALIGLGETSIVLAHRLKNAGADVIGFDQVKPRLLPIPIAESAEGAVADADVVLALSSSSQSLRTAESLAGTLKPGAIYADLNTGTPNLKRKLAELLPAGSFVDAAVMRPVQELTAEVRIDASGAGAAQFLQLLAPYDLTLEYVSDVPGEATARRLMRDLMDKGFASVMADTLWAAKALGFEDWAIAEIKSHFNESDAETVQEYLNETGKNPKRRSVEVGDISEVLAEAGYESTMLNGMGLTFSHIMHGRKIPFADLSE